MCNQQRLRSACAYAQSNQSLSQSFEYSLIVKLLTEHQLEFLSLTGGCRESSESTHVKILHCWKSHALAHLADGNNKRRQTSSHVKSGKPKDKGGHVVFSDEMVVEIDIDEKGPEEIKLKKFTRNDQKERRVVSGSKGSAKRINALKDKVGTVLTHKAPPIICSKRLFKFAAFSNITNKACYFMRIVCTHGISCLLLFRKLGKMMRCSRAV